MNFYYIFLLFLVPFIFQQANAQIGINVTQSDPCFLNYTAGVDMWRNCGFGTDFMKAALLPFEWVTGGLFSIIIVVVLCIMTYVKYHTIIYPITIGLVMLPISWFVLPDQFITFGFLALIIGIAATIWSVVVQRTNSN